MKIHDEAYAYQQNYKNLSPDIHSMKFKIQPAFMEA